MELVISFVLAFAITWAFTTRNARENNIHLTIAELVIKKYGESQQVIDAIYDLSVHNIKQGNSDYNVVLKALHDKGKGHGT